MSDVEQSASEQDRVAEFVVERLQAVEAGPERGVRGVEARIGDPHIAGNAAVGLRIAGVIGRGRGRTGVGVGHPDIGGVLAPAAGARSRLDLDESRRDQVVRAALDSGCQVKVVLIERNVGKSRAVDSFGVELVRVTAEQVEAGLGEF